MFFLYNLLFPLLFLFYLPFYLLHIFRRGGLSREYWERFGIFGSAKKARLRQLGSVVWIHAVSGETVAVSLCAPKRGAILTTILFFLRHQHRLCHRQGQDAC